MRIPARLRRTTQLAGYAGVAASLIAFAALALGPRTGHYRTLTVLSASMRPTIAEGSVVVVTPVPLGRIRVGDVLTYRIPVEDRRVVTHRVVEITEPGPQPMVRTKGDASGAPDPWVACLSEGPAWRVRASVPYAGYAIEALSHPVLRRVNVVVLPVGLALWSLVELWGGGRRSEGEAEGRADGDVEGEDNAGARFTESMEDSVAGARRIDGRFGKTRAGGHVAPGDDGGDARPAAPPRRTPAAPALACWGVSSPSCGSPG